MSAVGLGEEAHATASAGGSSSSRVGPPRILAGEALLGRVGSLQLYEILIGLLFISVILSWNPYTLPI
jgi:hypothetical protein